MSFDTVNFFGSEILRSMKPCSLYCSRGCTVLVQEVLSLWVLQAYNIRDLDTLLLGSFILHSWPGSKTSPSFQDTQLILLGAFGEETVEHTFCPHLFAPDIDILWWTLSACPARAPASDSIGLRGPQ